MGSRAYQGILLLRTSMIVVVVIVGMTVGYACLNQVNLKHGKKDHHHHHYYQKAMAMPIYSPCGGRDGNATDSLDATD